MQEILEKCPVCRKTDFSVFQKTPDHFLTKESFNIVSCNGCGFKFINPRPDKYEIGRYYQSKEYYSHDVKSGSLISRIYRIARAFSIKGKYKIISSLAEPGSILDIGCGTGEFLGYCRTRGFEVKGMEPNEKAAKYAQQVNKIPVTRNLSELTAAHNRFNCITLWHVLEHIHDLDETLESLKGLLASDGNVIIAVPNCNSWDAQKYGNYWAAYDVPRHLYHFTSVTLNLLVTNHGFEIHRIIPQKLDAYYVSMLSEKYQTGRNNFLNAFLAGVLSNLKAGKNGRGHSSLIFVLSLKKA